jgi:hypothetical protein
LRLIPEGGLRVFREAGAVIASIVLLLLSAGAACAEPADPALQRLIGTRVEGEFPIAGWEDMGGGLLQDPVWYAQYRRGDGAQLVLVEWAMPRRPGAKHLTFQITDVLVTPPLRNDAVLVFFCRTAQPNVTRKILAVVRADPSQEWWRDVQQAWAVDLDSGRIRPIPPKGIECANEAWGD